MGSPATTSAGVIRPSSYAGIYAASMNLTDSLSSHLPLKIYTSPAVTGVALSMNWANLETAPGVYDWAPLDYEINRALKYDKQISIAIEPNRFSAPSWLFQEGVPDLKFTVLNHGGLNTIDIAPPWNATYQQAYAQMMMALSNHLHSIPGAYQAVSVVKITGMSEVSAEIRLPNASNRAGRVTDTIPIWQQHGYTPAKVLAAWNGFAASVNAAFPDKMLAEEAVLDPAAFPTINNQGQFVSMTDPSFVNVVQGILSEGLAQYGGRFAVEWDALNDANMPATELAAEQLGVTGFWEANKYLPGGSGSGSNWQVKIPLTAADYQRMLDLGINQGAGQFLELWPKDILDFPSVVAAANALIATSLSVAAGATLEIPAASAANVSFAGLHGTLQLDQSASFTGYISGFRSSDAIDLGDMAFGAHTILSYAADPNNLEGTFTISDGQHTATIALVGQYAAANLQLASDSQEQRDRRRAISAQRRGVPEQPG
jgi:hypothetical protein